MTWNKAPLKAPNDYGPVEDWAFTMYAVDIEERRDRMQKALGHLINNPEDIDDIQWLYDLTDEEWIMVQEGVI